MAKCNRTVCNYEGIHTHIHNGKKYCSECVYEIQKPIPCMAVELDCFDITADEAWKLRRDDVLHTNKTNE